MRLASPAEIHYLRSVFFLTFCSWETAGRPCVLGYSCLPEFFRHNGVKEKSLSVRNFPLLNKIFDLPQLWRRCIGDPLPWQSALVGHFAALTEHTHQETQKQIITQSVSQLWSPHPILIYHKQCDQDVMPDCHTLHWDGAWFVFHGRSLGSQ